MSKIQEFHEKIKGLLHDDAIFTAILMVLVAVASFGLGRDSVAKNSLNLADLGSKTEEMSLESREVVNKPETPTTTAEGAFVASKNSDKYHLPWCSGAKRIKEENKVYFATAEEAKAAGYSPAANCPGL